MSPAKWIRFADKEHAPTREIYGAFSRSYWITKVIQYDRKSAGDNPPVPSCRQPAATFKTPQVQVRQPVTGALSLRWKVENAGLSVLWST